MNILLLGKDGQVGHALQALLPALGKVTAWDQQDVDFLDLEGLREKLATVKADVIINAAAYTAVDRAQTDASTAHCINASAVKVLAAHAAHAGALFVHYSTDYVFDGEKPSPYVESDQTNPQSEYGKSKRAGELAALGSGCKALVFRTSWVFSSHGGNFIKTILRLAAERESLNVVADQIGAPTSARLIAETTVRAIPVAHSGTLPPGLYHLTAAGHTSWHGLASYVVSRAANNGAVLKLQADHIQPIPTEAYPLPAPRPKNSRLDTTFLQDLLKFEFPAWREDVARVVDELTLSRTQT